MATNAASEVEDRTITDECPGCVDSDGECQYCRDANVIDWDTQDVEDLDEG